MVRKITIFVLSITLAIVIAAGFLSGRIIDWLWYRSLGYTEVFWTSMVTKFAVVAFQGVLLFFFLFLNLSLTKKAFLKEPAEENGVSKKHLLISISLSLVFTLFLLPGFNCDWRLAQQFIHQTKAGITDPIFHKDLGFYLFLYPLLQNSAQLALALLVLTLLTVTALYLIAQTYWGQERRLFFWPKARKHLTFLGITFLVVKAFDYYLSRFSLLFEEKDLLTGVDFTARQVRVFGYNILIVITLISALLLLASIYRRQYAKILYSGIGLWLLVSFLTGVVFPYVVETVFVRPNQFLVEEEYLQNHIDFTRLGYGLHRIREETLLPKPLAELTAISPDHPSLANLRVWDFRPLLPSYNQLQSIRSYYRFNDIDIDRYDTKLGQRQVMLAARELDSQKLPPAAANWLNLHLTYTHGYGLAMNLVNQITNEGQPRFIAKNLPPQIDPEFPDLTAISRPEIYFGEVSNHYILVNTKQKEFDYPLGEKNVTTTYRGRDGISLRRFMTRMLLTISLKEKNFILSNYITKDSRIIMHRDVKERVSRLAPFLHLDDDPYLVVADGKLYWIIDCYTLSSFMPYAKRHLSGFNYIRNSAKAVVDAYHGTVDFYLTDEEDPIIKTWQKVFPRLFQPLSQMPENLIKHLRYPEVFFSAQRDILLTYHMTDPKAFYEQEDYWSLPTQIYGDSEELMDPYYVTLRLPEEAQSEFLLMQPYTPREKRNMISWLAGRCDPPHYGELVLYTLPKDTNIYGPMQIEARIGQNPEIAEMTTLWNQNQSRLIRGNLLVIPIDGFLLYAEPFYIVSEQGQIPEFKKIILAYGEKIVIGDNLSDAVQKLNAAHGFEATAIRREESSHPETIDRDTKAPQTKETPSKDYAETLIEMERTLQKMQSLFEQLKASQN